MVAGPEQRVEELERENAWLRRVLANDVLLAALRQVDALLSDVVWVYQPNGPRVLYVSSSYERVWGRRCRSLYADPGSWLNAVHAEDRERVADALRHRSVGEVWTEEYRIVRPDGDVRFILARSALTQQPQGPLIVASVAQDVSERHQAEERTRAREADLAHLQRLGTMGELAAGLAHELQQPLACIATRAEICKLALDSQAPDVRALGDDVGEIAEQAGRAGRLLHQLRRFVRKSDPRTEVEALDPLVRGALELCRREARERGVSLVEELSAPDVKVRVDAIQVEQAVLNVVRNAVEVAAQQEGSRRAVHVSSRADGAWCEVAVRDFGPQRSDDLLEKIFFPFYTTRKDGLGMGLPISRSVAEAHGGTLRAVQNPEGGLTLCLRFPQMNSSL